MTTGRWALPDRESAFDWCAGRNSEDIRCVIDVMGEDVSTPEAVSDFVSDYVDVIREIDRRGFDVSVSVKPTAIGARTDRALARDNIVDLSSEASGAGVGFEIDMEGTPLVDMTLDAAIACADAGHPVMLALQAYLDRTVKDLERVLDAGVEVRLVKGAYMGDVGDFAGVQGRFRSLVERLVETRVPFCVGTHDPELVEWLMERDVPRDRIEFGFLMGLGDETKAELVMNGWQVSEYVPYGDDVRAYELRRMRYLKSLGTIGREPVP